jgi:hypothetical protein
MSEHLFQDELEERDDIVGTSENDGDDASSEGEPWAKASSGNADEITSD